LSIFRCLFSWHFEHAVGFKDPNMVELDFESKLAYAF